MDVEGPGNAVCIPRFLPPPLQIPMVMNSRSRILLALATLALLAVYILPVWHITLDAPQYPEGLGMYIRINTIEGQSEGNLNSINALNHYIGMKPIVPESIPELKILPWVFAALIAFGLAAAAVGKRWMLYLWVALFALVMACSLVDFYLWGYDYGHNLDEEHAIIKVPGMSYQPPLIGTKQMLNITASSWPAIGGCIAALSFAAGCALTFVEARRTRPSSDVKRPVEAKRRKPATIQHGWSSRVLILLPALFLAAGCTPGPEPIRYGHERCAHCLMTISDQRFGAELVSTTGKIYKFDSIECLAAFHHAGKGAPEVHSVWVTDYQNPPQLIDAAKSAFIYSPDLHSPMGANLAAVSQANAETALAELNGQIRTWNDVLERTGSRHTLPSAVLRDPSAH